MIPLPSLPDVASDRLRMLVIDLTTVWGGRVLGALGMPDWKRALNSNRRLNLRVKVHEQQVAVAWLAAGELSCSEIERVVLAQTDTHDSFLLLVGPGPAEVLQCALRACEVACGRQIGLKVHVMLAPNALGANAAMSAWRTSGQHAHWLSYGLATSSDERTVLRDAVNQLFPSGPASDDSLAVAVPTNSSSRPALTLVAGGVGQPSVTLGITDQKADVDAAEFLQPPTTKGMHMSSLNESMNAIMQIDGALAAALVDYGSGMALAKQGSAVNLDAAAAGNTEVVKAKMRTMAGLGIKDVIEDILITLGKHYHLIRIVPHKPGLFLYVVLDKEKSNLALARYKLADIEKTISV